MVPAMMHVDVTTLHFAVELQHEAALRKPSIYECAQCSLLQWYELLSSNCAI